MLRTAIRLSPSFIFPLFEQRNDNDYNRLQKPNTYTPQNGLERVKEMFTKK